MRIIGAFDVHRKQITYKWLDTETGEIQRGRIMPGVRKAVREFLVPFEGLDAHFALEATTGWRFVAEELSRVGLVAHLAEPADTAALRGSKRRAKTDRRDCDHMMDLLGTGRLPESWLPPAHVLGIRTLVRLRKALTDTRREWQQRVQAQLFHQGVPRIPAITTQGRAQLAAVDLSAAGRQVVDNRARSDRSPGLPVRTSRYLPGPLCLRSGQAVGPSSNACSASATSRRFSPHGIVGRGKSHAVPELGPNVCGARYHRLRVG